MNSKKLVSVVLSFRNEEDVLPILIQRLKAVLDPLTYDYELLFINDASTDQSLQILTPFCLEDSRIKLITMARRFGVPPCLMAGLSYASGDAVITMDADLQDPPELISKLIFQWESGAEVVLTVRTSRLGESKLKMKLTRWAYQLLNRLSEVPLPVEAGDFRLLGRRALNELLKHREQLPYLRGLVASLGLKRVEVPYIREKRYGGKSHFPLLSSGPIQTFLSGLISFSPVPLYFFLAAGTLLLFLTFVSSIILFFVNLFSQEWNPLAWFLAGIFSVTAVQLMGIGVLGLYLWNILKQVQNRPAFIVESTINIDKNSSIAAERF